SDGLFISIQMFKCINYRCYSNLRFCRCKLIIKTSTKSFHMQQQQHQPAEFTQQRDAQAQQQSDPGMSLHEYFKSPEAIQSLLCDCDKLCQLLEQHLKLMQMLQ
ncbi:hypothetical protein S83_068823, partial [Arachis hypogaea]